LCLMKRCHVFCTEPFRIPLAGRVNTCCFDKTGTLTSDELVFLGLQLDKQEHKLIRNFDDFPLHALRIMVGCHNLTSTARHVDKASPISHSKLLGEPLEKTLLTHCHWMLVSNGWIVFFEYESCPISSLCI
jgi:cation-transporting ATPase 13A1